MSASDRPRTLRRPQRSFARTPGARVAAISLAVGSATAGVIAGVRELGLLHGPTALILVALALVAIPSSRELSRRLVLTGLIAFGWWQAAWWLPLTIDRGALTATLTAGLSAASVTWVALSSGWRATVPRVRGVDALPFVAGGVGLLVTRRWTEVESPADALANLMPGWDNSGHFDMFHMIWTHGATIDAITPPAGGDSWHYYDYPQGFHATAATLAQLMWPGAVHDVGSSLMAYSRVSVVLVVLSTSLAVAGICALPQMRRRWYVATPVSALIIATFLIGPGMDSVRAGFAAFVVPSAILAASVPVALMIRRVASPLPWAATCGAMVFIAHGWALMMLIAVPIVVMALVPFEARRWRASRVRWGLTGVVVIASLVGALRALVTLLGGGDSRSLTLPGGIAPPPFAATLGLTLAILGVAVWTVGARRIGRGSTAQVIVLTSSVGWVLVTASLLARAQIEAHGEIGYYTWKFLLAWLFASPSVLATIIAVAIRTTHPPSSALAGSARAGILFAAPSLLLSAALLQVFGYVGPVVRSIGLTTTDSTASGDLQYGITVDSVRSTSADLLAAFPTFNDPTPQDALLLRPGQGPMSPISTQQWYLSLTGAWTSRSNIGSLDLEMGQSDLAGAAFVAQTWLRSHDGRLVVDPDVASYLRERAMLDEALVARTATWAD